MDKILKKITDEVWMDMVNPQTDKLAEKIAKSIFDVGNERGLKTGRIQFMLGEYPKETPAGGLCFEALKKVIKESLLGS